jgi:hypothetical protein
MTRSPRPTKLGFLQYMREAGHEAAVLDAVSLGVYWREYVKSLSNREQYGEAK